MFTDPELDRFLDEALPPEQMAELEARCATTRRCRRG